MVVAPFTQYRFITPILIFVSIALTAVLMLMGMGDEVQLWTNWFIAGLLSAVSWRIISRFNLQGGSELKAFGISWPILTAGLQFVYCHFPSADHYAKVLLLVIVQMCCLSLSMSLWQRRRSPFKCLLLGLFIGLESLVVPQSILWLLLFIVVGYYMRCWSMRNTACVLTGAFFAVWVGYCLRFFLNGAAEADALILAYSVILRDESYAPLLALHLWQYLFMGLTLLLLIIYSLSGFLLGAGQSIRAASSIKLISVLSLSFVVLLPFDILHFFGNLSVFSLFISLQLTIHQANVRSIFHEWWILLIILSYIALCLLPLFY